MVCLKPVPRGIKKVRLDPEKGVVKCESSSFLMNECDEFALDAALLWRKEQEAEVTALTVGGIRSQDVLYLAVAKGADQIVRIDADVSDSAGAAQVIAAALQGKGYDLILTGVESEDNMSSQVGTAVAELLHVPYAFAVTRVTFTLEPRKIRVLTEMGGGVQEELEITLPAVLAVQSGISPLTYAPAAKIMKARRNLPHSIPLNKLGIKGEELEAARYRTLDVFEPPKADYAEVLTGTPSEIADLVMDKVKDVLGRE